VEQLSPKTKKTLSQILIVGGLLSLVFVVDYLTTESNKAPEPISSVEVGITSVSPRGKDGGLAIPASPAYSQGYYYGQGYYYAQGSYFIDLKANDSDGPLTFPPLSSEVTLSWTGSNLISCLASGLSGFSGSKSPLSGSEIFNISHVENAFTETPRLDCTSPAGDVFDSVLLTFSALEHCDHHHHHFHADDSTTFGADCDPDFFHHHHHHDHLPDFFLTKSNDLEVRFTGGAGDISDDTTIRIVRLEKYLSDTSFTASPAILDGVSVTYVFSDPTLSPSEYSIGSQFHVEIPEPISDGVYTITVIAEGGGLLRTITVELTAENFLPAFEEF